MVRSAQAAHNIVLDGLEAGEASVIITADGDVTQQASAGNAIHLDDLTLDVGGNVTLDENANDFDSIAGTAANLTVNDANNLDLAGVDVGAGELDITAGASLTDSADNTAGAVTLTVGVSATLDNENDFDSIAGITPYLTVVDVDDLELAGLQTDDRGITVTTGGDLTDSAANYVGMVTLNVAGSVVLDDAGNNFLGVRGTVTNLTVHDVNTLNLAGVNGGTGTLNITVGGNLTDSTANFAGAVTLAVSGDATLDNANDFDSIVGTAKNLTVTDANNLDLAGVDVGTGDLDITTGGALTDSAANTAGAVTLAVSGDATLDNANDFDSIAGTAANLTVNDVDDLKIAGVTAPAGRIQVNAGNIVMGSVTAGTAGFNANGSVSDDGSDVNAGVLTIIASGDIGSKDKPIQMTAKEIRTISGRNVHLRENTREGVVKLESIKAQGDISLVAKDIGGPTGRNGGFIDANGDAVNLQAGNDILVDAGGWFGTYSDPMEVVFGGNFTIRSVNDRDVNNGTRRTPISESPVGLVIADGRILGGTPELIRRLNRAFAYTANPPELKCSQGTFGRPVFFHTLPNDSEAKSVSVVDRLDVDADKNTHGEDLSVVDDMLEDGTFKSWNPRPDDAVLRNWTDESKSDRASRPQSDIQESEN